MKCYFVRNIAKILFVLLQTILYVSFLILDIAGNHITLSNHIKIIVIILCFCYALFLGKGANKGIIFCLKLGLFFTVISDLFILMLDIYICGVLTFIIVQQLYGIRILLYEEGVDGKERDVLINKQGRKSFLSKLTHRVILQLIVSAMIYLILYWIGSNLDFLLIISVFYFVCIVSNTISAISLAIHNPFNKNNLLFAVGMGLFLLCDINVGIFNMSGFLSLQSNLYGILYSASSILMWTFYAPSQVLISLSTSKLDNLKDNN